MKLNELLKENASDFITDVNEIEAWLKEMEIKNYTIRDDGIVDVDGEVNLSYKTTDQMSVRFGKVTGNFFCSNDELTTLAGCPSQVGGSFCCDNNQLTSLRGGPTHVGRHFYCNFNQLTALVGCPTTVGNNLICSNNQLASLNGCPTHVSGNFYCNNNQLTSLVGCPSTVGSDFDCHSNKLISLEFLPSKIGGDIYCHRNDLKSHVISVLLTGCENIQADGDWVYIIEKYLGRPDDIFECQAELIENDFEEFALL